MQKIIEFLCYLTEKNDLNKEYLLKNDQSENKTTVTEGYFF